LTVKGKGVTRLRASGRGDLKIAFQVVTPTKLDSKQKELFRNLAKLRKTDSIKLVKHHQGFFAGKRR
jgi:molecular chaperone DnaJ